MEYKKIEIDVPEQMIPFMLISDGEEKLRRNAMLLYPYIQNGTISHGKAAEILGIHKLDLIVLYGKLGLDYLNTDADDLQQDLQTLRKVRRRVV